MSTSISRRRIVEMNGQESDHLLAYLTDWVKQPAFTVRYRWRAGTIGMWDNRFTHDLARCRLIARAVALVYDWWSLYARLIDPEHHREAITSRPLLLHVVARQVRHGRQTRLLITCSHADAPAIRRRLALAVASLQGLNETAEPLSDLETWCRILSRALIKYLHGRVIRPPPGYPARVTPQPEPENQPETMPEWRR